MNKLRQIVLPIIVVGMLLLFSKNVNAAESLLLKSAAVDYTSAVGLSLDGVVKTAETLDDINEIATHFIIGYTEENENRTYKLYMTTDMYNYSSSNIDDIVTNLRSVDEGSTIIPVDMYAIGLDVYMTLDIISAENIVTHEIIKVSNGEYTLVTIPDIDDNYYELGIYKYKNDYVYAGYKSIDENQTTYKYYITKNLETWVEKTIDLSLFTNSPKVVGLLTIHSSGLGFIGTTDNTNETEILLTADYTNYTIVDESSIVTGENIEIIREEIKSEDLSYSMIVSYGKNNETDTFGNNIYSGFDVYLSEIYPNDYKNVISYKENIKNMKWYFSWSEDETIESPIVIFTDRIDDSVIYVFEDYRDEEYIEYSTTIEAGKITELTRNSFNGSFILYDNKYLIYSDNNFETALVTELPGEYTNILIDPMQNVVLLNDTESIVITLQDIFNLHVEIKLANCSISGFNRNVYYTGEEIIQDTLNLEYDGYKLSEGKDYSVSYVDNINVGWGVMTVTGKGNYTGTITKTFMIRPAAVTNLKKVSRTTTSIKFSWKNKTPGVYGYKIYKYDFDTETYKYFGKTTSTTYTAKKLVSGSTNLFKVIPYIIVDDKQYNGAESTILKEVTQPTKTTITLKAGKKKATITWKRPRGVNGYEIYMKQGSSGKWSRVKTITSASTLKYTKSSLKKWKRYYFKVRSYKYLDGQKIYSPWSATKSVVVK